jgi:hypothetical protein
MKPKMKKQGLQLAKSLGCNRIIIKSDNHDVDKIKPKPWLHVKRNGFIRIKKKNRVCVLGPDES